MLSLTHATKLFGSVIGVNDVTVEFGPGAHGLLGPNGAGKTTLLGLVTGQLRPTMGIVRVFGERPFANPQVLRRIGFCPAADLTERRATPREWVRYLVRLSGFYGAETKARADRALEAVGLAEAADRPLGTLSKGMRQRAKLAGAMAHDPDLLVLDEPFDGLDPMARHDLVGLVRRWATAEQGGAAGDRCLIVASHLLHEVESLEAGLAVILGGRLVASGTAAEIRGMVASLPTEIHIRCERPRRLAAALCAADACESVRFGEDGGLVVSTRQPRQVAEQLARAAVGGQLGIRGVTADDRSLEGIFGRLVRLHRGWHHE
jgi:ABC-2 type transport system ATP-binding protein